MKNRHYIYNYVQHLLIVCVEQASIIYLHYFVSSISTTIAFNFSFEPIKLRRDWFDRDTIDFEVT